MRLESRQSRRAATPPEMGVSSLRLWLLISAWMVPWNEEPISLDNAARAFQNDPWEDLVMRNARIATAIVQTIAASAVCIVLGAGNDSTPVSFQILGIKMTLEVTAPQSNGASVTIEERVPPGGGPPAHIHTREDETIVVTQGHFRFWHGTRVVDALPGTVVYFPRNEPHQFRNVGSTPGDLVVTIMPAGLERMFLAISKRGLTIPKDLAEIVRLGREYGITYVRPLAPQTTAN
jgi:mannose-6-phosphate isomerase-like protein (cupin superfamily)